MEVRLNQYMDELYRMLFTERMTYNKSIKMRRTTFNSFSVNLLKIWKHNKFWVYSCLFVRDCILSIIDLKSADDSNLNRVAIINLIKSLWSKCCVLFLKNRAVSKRLISKSYAVGVRWCIRVSYTYSFTIQHFPYTYSI